MDSTQKEHDPVDDQELRQGLLRLAEPLPTTPRAVDAVVTNVKTRRRRHRVIGVVVGIVGVVATGFAIGQLLPGQEQTLRPAGPPRQVEMETFASEYGIRLSIRPSFSDDRELTSPSTHVGDLAGRGYLWPLDGTDYEGVDLTTVSLSAGTKVSYETTVKPDCRDDDRSPAIEFSIPATLSDGQKVMETFVPSNPETYTAAYRLWCDIGVGVQAGGGSLGRASRVALLINNGREEDIAVTMPALSSGDVSWKKVSTTVPGGEQVTVTAVGMGVQCGSDQAEPWADGRILVNGKPLNVPVVDAWCN